MEYPIAVKREITVKQDGHITDSSFNPEIVTMKTHIFIMIFRKRFPEIDGTLKIIIQEKYDNDIEMKKILNENIHWSDRIEGVLKNHKEKIQFFTNIFSPIF